MRTAPAMFVATMAIGIGIACKSSTGSGNTCASTGAQQTINTTDSRTFSPPSATVSPSQTVCWQNQGALTHSITADNPADSFDVTLPPSYVAIRGTGTIGTDFHYHCRFHASMIGVIQTR